VESSLKTIVESKNFPLMVASANWVATGWLVSAFFLDCIVIDTGSTTTSIIPVKDGKIIASGKNDLEKLINGELVYTGALRSNIATIVNNIPLKKGYATLSSELFSLSGDVHLILGNISVNNYTTETADGRGKTKREAMARIARTVCADVDMLNEKEIVDIAQYIYRSQVNIIANALQKVYVNSVFSRKENIPIVVTGLGKKFLSEVADREAGFKNIVHLEEVIGYDISIISPAFGIAIMIANKFLGVKIVRGFGN
jgi:probable H4MPT-linked C1 transfer pathway protein